ncbi:hypothetical protein PVAG01_08251 [Phlyctema vagabunda]|uniref:MYND-type domain-containing protein n=1 Tax=Phlyctema vagabunda TaxID=108571 RepID=A0ABR4P8X3_9HELO
MVDTQDSRCATCLKKESTLSEPLQRCAKCKTTRYCSRECQKEDWKTHKRTCHSASTADPRGSTSSQARHNPGSSAINSFLGGADSLEGLPEQAVYFRLIDCFRMRAEDEYTFAGNRIGVYAGSDDGLPDFQEFLDLAESRSGILPAWWNQQKRRECEQIAVRPMVGPNMAEGSINTATDKPDIQEHYGNSMMPMQLRVLGEKIYGRGFM